jgi:hypothetical protein
MNLCKSILESDLFVLHTSVFSVIRWFGKAYETQLDQIGIFSLLKERSANCSYALRLADTLTLFEQFGRQNTNSSIDVLCGALNSDLPPVRLRDFMKLLMKEIWKRPKLPSEEAVPAANVILKILQTLTLSDARDLVRELFCFKRMSEDIFFQTNFLSQFCKAFAGPHGQILDFANIFKLYVLDGLLGAPTQRDEQIAKVSGHLIQAGFWESLAVGYKEISSSPTPLKRPHWAFGSNCVVYSYEAVLSLLAHGPLEIIQAAYRANFFDSFISVMQPIFVVFPTIGEAFAAYIGALYVMDRAITHLLSIEDVKSVEKIRSNFIEQLLRNPLNQSLFNKLSNIAQYFPTQKEWLEFATRYCDLDRRLEPFFLHYSVYNCRGLFNLPAQYSDCFIRRLMKSHPELRGLEELSAQASQTISPLFEKQSLTSKIQNTVKQGIDKGLKLAIKLFGRHTPNDDSEAQGDVDSSSSSLPKNEEPISAATLVVETLKLNQRPALPDVFEFLALCVDTSIGSHYFEVSKRIFIMLSFTRGEPSPLSLSWMTWQMEMTFAVWDSQDLIASRLSNGNALYQLFKNLSLPFMQQWGDICRAFYLHPSRLLEASNWANIWPHTTSRLFSIYKKDEWRNFATSNIEFLRTFYLSNFFASCPPSNLFDLFKDNGMALGILEHTIGSTTAQKARESPFFVILLSMVLDDSLSELDPRVPAEIDKAWQECKKLGMGTYERRVGPGVGPLKNFTISLVKALDYLPVTNRGSGTYTKSFMDLNRFIVDVDMRYFVVINILKIFDSIDIEALIPSMEVMSCLSPSLMTLIMDPNPTISSLAMNIYEKVVYHLCAFAVYPVNCLTFEAPNNDQLWTFFLTQPTEKAIKWMNIRSKIHENFRNQFGANLHTFNNVSTNEILVANQYHICRWMLEYIHQLDLFVNNPEDWISKMQAATKKHDLLVEERMACFAKQPKDRSQFSTWISSRISQPKLGFNQSFPTPDRAPHLRIKIGFPKIVGAFTHFPSDPILVLHTLLEMIVICIRALPTQSAANWPLNSLAPRRGIAYVPSDIPKTLLPTSSSIDPDVSFDVQRNEPDKKAKLIGVNRVPTQSSNSRPDPCAIFAKVADASNFQPWILLPECIERCMALLSVCLTAIPDSAFPIHSDILLSEMERDGSEEVPIKIEEMVIELICRMISFGVSFQLKPSSGILIPLKRYLSSFEKSLGVAELRNFAENSIIGHWSEYLFCTSKSAVSIFLPFTEQDLDFEASIRDRLLSALLVTGASSHHNWTQVANLLEILFLLVHKNWKIHEKIVIPSLDAIIRLYKNNFVMPGSLVTNARNKTLLNFLARLLAFLALYRPTDPAPPPSDLYNSPQNLLEPPLRIAYRLEIDDSIPSPIIVSSSPNASPKKVEMLNSTSDTFNPKSSEMKGGQTADSKISPRNQDIGPKSPATIMSSFELWCSLIYQYHKQPSSKGELALKSSLPAFFSNELYERLRAIVVPPIVQPTSAATLASSSSSKPVPSPSEVPAPSKTLLRVSGYHSSSSEDY